MIDIVWFFLDNRQNPRVHEAKPQPDGGDHSKVTSNVCQSLMVCASLRVTSAPAIMFLQCFPVRLSLFRER